MLLPQGYWPALGPLPIPASGPMDPAWPLWRLTRGCLGALSLRPGIREAELGQDRPQPDVKGLLHQVAWHGLSCVSACSLEQSWGRRRKSSSCRHHDSFPSAGSFPSVSFTLQGQLSTATAFLLGLHVAPGCGLTSLCSMTTQPHPSGGLRLPGLSHFFCPFPLDPTSVHLASFPLPDKGHLKASGNLHHAESQQWTQQVPRPSSEGREAEKDLGGSWNLLISLRVGLRMPGCCPLCPGNWNNLAKCPRLQVRKWGLELGSSWLHDTVCFGCVPLSWLFIISEPKSSYLQHGETDALLEE